MILDHHVFDAIVLDKHALYDSVYMVIMISSLHHYDFIIVWFYQGYRSS